jgi:hypothetical protein
MNESDNLGSKSTNQATVESAVIVNPFADDKQEQDDIGDPEFLSRIHSELSRASIAKRSLID